MVGMISSSVRLALEVQNDMPHLFTSSTVEYFLLDLQNHMQMTAL